MTTRARTRTVLSWSGEKDSALARQVQSEHWHRRPVPTRAAHWAAYGFARLLTGLFAYGQAREFT